MDGHSFGCFFDSFSRSAAQSVKLEDGANKESEKLSEVELTLQLEDLQTLVHLKSVQEYVLCPKVHWELIEIVDLFVVFLVEHI